MTSEFQVGDRVSIDISDTRNFFLYKNKQGGPLTSIIATIVAKDGPLFLVNDFDKKDFYGMFSRKYGNCNWFHKRRFSPVIEQYDPIQNGDTDEDV